MRASFFSEVILVRRVMKPSQYYTSLPCLCFSACFPCYGLFLEQQSSFCFFLFFLSLGFGHTEYICLLDVCNLKGWHLECIIILT